MSSSKLPVPKSHSLFPALGKSVCKNGRVHFKGLIFIDTALATACRRKKQCMAFCSRGQWESIAEIFQTVRPFMFSLGFGFQYLINFLRFAEHWECSKRGKTLIKGQIIHTVQNKQAFLPCIFFRQLNRHAANSLTDHFFQYRATTEDFNNMPVASIEAEDYCIPFMIHAWKPN